MFILLGIVIGFAAAVPLGPVNVFIVSQTLKHDYVHGLMAGLTTAAMDTLYCLVALVGFFHFHFNLAPYAGWMKGVAMVLLVGLGVRLIRQAAKTDPPVLQEKRTIKPSRPILGVILLYLSNPTIYAFWIAVAGTVTAHSLVADTGWLPDRLRHLLRCRGRALVPPPRPLRRQEPEQDQAGHVPETAPLHGDRPDRLRALHLRDDLRLTPPRPFSTLRPSRR